MDADNLNALGAVPEELGVLTTLVTVDFNFNGFLGGTIPQSICALTNLRQLSMGFTDVGGSLPSCINQLSNLELLFVSWNSCTEHFLSLPLLNCTSSICVILFVWNIVPQYQAVGTATEYEKYGKLGKNLFG